MAKRARTGLLANLETKVMALIMAVVLYVYATSERSVEEGNVLVSLIVRLPEATTAQAMLPEKKAPEKMPEHVFVSFSGPQKAIENLREVRSQLSVEYTADDKGHENDDEWDTTVALTPGQVKGVPHEVTVTRIEPDTFTLTIARTMEKELKVRLNLQGEPPQGFEISKPPDEPKVFPGVIKVSGPKRVLARAMEISTKAIRLSDLLAIADFRNEDAIGLEQAVEVKVDNRVTLEPITCNQSVKYYIWLTQVKKKKELKNLPVKIMTPPNFPYVARLVRSLEKVDVQVQGLEQSVNLLNENNVKAFVDVSDQRPSSRTDTPPAPVSLPVEFKLPDEVQGKVEVLNEPPKKVGVDILEPPKAGTLPPR